MFLNTKTDDENIRTVMDTVQLCQKFWSGKTSKKIISDDKMYEAQLLKLDNKKMKRFLRINPKYDFEQALEQTIQWYLEYYNKNNMKEITENQIKSYFDNS